MKQPNKESSAHHANGILSNHCPKTWSDTGGSFALSGKSSLKRAYRKTVESWGKQLKTKKMYLYISKSGSYEMYWNISTFPQLKCRMLEILHVGGFALVRPSQNLSMLEAIVSQISLAMPALIVFQSACMLWSQSPAKFCSSCTWHHCYKVQNSSELKNLRQQTEVNVANANQNLPHSARGNSILSHSVFFKKIKKDIKRSCRCHANTELKTWTK